MFDYGMGNVNVSLCGDSTTMNWRAAVLAGIAAGIAATVVQVMLWALFQQPLPEMLYRDARLAAAIILGSEVLPPPASFAASVFAVAMLVHVALSIVYGLIVAALIARRHLGAALLIGAAFGAVLFALNMYGFTAVFPWFEVARDWITFAAHIAFGISAAGVYRGLASG